MAQYGKALLCVRYRYDKIRRLRLKTVEIVVEEKTWPPVCYNDEDVVSIMVAYTEKTVRDTLKAVGGRWDPERKVWRVAYGSIRGTELEKRILED